MSDVPKPALVALRDRREEVIQLLTDAFANDLLDIDTFEDRLARAHAATTIAALDEIVGDVAPLPPDATRTALRVLEPEPQAATTAPKPVLAIFSSVERHGAWIVPQSLRTLTVFGSAVLDFRDARFGEGVTELHVRAIFGSIEILVPPHLAVDCEGTAVFASFESHGTGAADDPGRPRLRITGSAVFGSVEVATRLPGETHAESRRRARALPSSAPRALPAPGASSGRES